MGDIHDILLFIGLSWVLVITPGPDTIYVLTQGISAGKKAGVISAVGVTLGIFVHTVFAALGLSIILKTSAIAFMIVKIFGAVYLIYLGIKILNSKDDMKITKEKKTSLRKIFTRGLISNIFNPKVALFFIAFLPQFIKTNGTEIPPMPFLILGTIFALFVMLFLSVIGYFAGSVGQYLKTKSSISKWINKISGSIMVMLGISLFFLKKK